MGRGNYPTLKRELFDVSGWGRVTAADCTKQGHGEDKRCVWCDPITDCPYECAKRTLLRSELGCINTSYFLTECNYVGRLSGGNFVVVDECDTVESELMGFVGVDIPNSRIKEFELGEPRYVTKEEAWLEWARGAYEKVKSMLRERPEDSNSDLRTIRRYNHLDRLDTDIGRLVGGLESGSWVYTGKDGRVSFKPIRVDGLGEKYLWQHGKRWLLMSGTVVSPAELVGNLGYKGNWGSVSLPSTFLPSNRQVKVIPVADMSRKAVGADGSDSIECEVEAICKIIARHRGQRVLVHTVSYQLASDLAVGVSRRTTRKDVSSFIYGSSTERDETLRNFLRDDDGSIRDNGSTKTSILFAPSMDRGIDLPDDACRVIIIAKVPYPNLGDRQVAARLYSHGGQTWYNVQTVRKIIQMTGRGVRHEGDWCVSYILDRNFATGIWMKGRELFSEWWREGLDWKDKL
jgi:Rad3-related DNA helicase